MPREEQSEEFISGEENRRRSAVSSQQGRKVTVPVTLLTQIAVVVVLCGLSFYAGSASQRHNNKNAKGLQSSANDPAGNQRGGRFGGARRAGTIGQVTAVSDTSITVNDQRSGTSKTFSIDSSTMISNDGQTVAANSITTSDTVLVSTSSTTSTVATRILVNPAFGGAQAAPDASSDTQAN